MSPQTVVPSVEALHEFEGVALGVSEWIDITQERIDAFADATDDHQWIHCDVERAKRESPFETTIAHGYLTLSLAPALLQKIVTIEGMTSAINTGCEKVRLSTPVLAGSRVRMSATIKETRSVPGGGVRTTLALRCDVEGEKKPACLAHVNYVYFG